MNSGGNSHRIKEFEQQGFVLIKNFFDTQAMASLTSELEKCYTLKEEVSNLNSDGLTFHSNLFKSSSGLSKFIASKGLSELLEALSGENNWVRWDQIITKSPGGVVFPWHRDNAYNKLKSPHFQLWIPTTPMNAENGGLWVIPGSHLWDKTTHHKEGTHWVAKVDEDRSICIDANPGDILVFSSLLFHKTKVNETDKDRTAYVVEYVRQTDFDPGIEPPYLFINNAEPVWLERHPKDGWFNRQFSSLKGKHTRHTRNI